MSLGGALLGYVQPAPGGNALCRALRHLSPAFDTAERAVLLDSGDFRIETANREPLCLLSKVRGPLH